MKKSILITGALITTCSLAAWGYAEWNNTDSTKKEVCPPKATKCKAVQKNEVTQKDIEFLYDVDSRFIATITKQKLGQARTLADLVPKNATDDMKAFEDIKITVLNEDYERIVEGVNAKLNVMQLDLLKSIDYSTNFRVEAYCKYKDPYTGKVEGYDFVYYITVVPEQEAEFIDGQEALISTLKSKSNEVIADADISVEQLKSGKVTFVVNKNGEITDVTLESSSGYSTIDAKMVELISNLPGKWNAATNAKGETIDQLLVFSFGRIGC
jgi:hypothetical protein